MVQKNSKLEREMQLRGWGCEKVAEMVGTDARTVRRWINGTNPQYHFREKLCEVFGKNAEELGLMKVETNGIATSEDVDNTDLLPTLERMSQNSLVESYQDTDVIDPEKETTRLLLGEELLQQQEDTTANLSRRKRFSVHKVPRKRVLVPLVLSLIILVSLISYLGYLSQRDQSVPAAYKDTLTPSSNNSARSGAKWNDTSYCQFVGDGFHVIDLYEKGRHACVAENLVFSDLDISVDVKMNHAAFVTFYLRTQAVPHGAIMGYYVRINRSGKYSIQYNANKISGHTDLNVPWTPPDSKSLKPDEGNWNTVRIKLQGSNISLWFNSNSKSQPDYAGKVPLLPSSKGMVGFGAATDEDVNKQKPPLDVVFRNLTIYDLRKQ